jgi:hypothetical protein
MTAFGRQLPEPEIGDVRGEGDGEQWWNGSRWELAHPRSGGSQAGSDLAVAVHEATVARRRVVRLRKIAGRLIWQRDEAKAATAWAATELVGNMREWNALRDCLARAESERDALAERLAAAEAQLATNERLLATATWPDGMSE